METSSVYWQNIDVLNYLETRMPEETGQPFNYQFYVDISRKDYQPPASYDLSKNAEDVCFQIHSAEMLSSGATTNVVTIPKEAIAAALKQ